MFRTLGLKTSLYNWILDFLILRKDYTWLINEAPGDMTNQVSDVPTERTFQYQHSLPPLPVPSLEGSLAKYLDAVRPFATEEEYQVTAAVVKRFGEGIGKDLHQKLLQRARTRRNWLEEWWLNSSGNALPLPVECELLRSCILPRALLAPYRRSRATEDQHKHVAHYSTGTCYALPAEVSPVGLC